MDGVRTSNSVDALLCARSRIALVVADEAARVRRAVVVVQDDVVGEWERQHETEAVAVGGDEADAPGVEIRAAMRVVTSRPPRATVPRALAPAGP